MNRTRALNFSLEHDTSQPKTPECEIKASTRLDWLFIELVFELSLG